MPYAVQPGDIVVPSYWPDSGWSPWHENPAFEVAELPRGSLMFQALERYINGNIQARSFRAKKAERTRMQRAEAIVQDTSGKYNARWKLSAAHRLKEKPENGGTTPPPSSGPVDVAKILQFEQDAAAAQQPLLHAVPGAARQHEAAQALLGCQRR
jgi:hypothetical protein